MQEIDLHSAERQIDALIERRAAEREQDNYGAGQWRSSVRRYDLAQARELQLEWIAHHRRLAVLFDARAAYHREAAGRLIDQGASS